MIKLNTYKNNELEKLYKDLSNSNYKLAKDIKRKIELEVLYRSLPNVIKLHKYISIDQMTFNNDLTPYKYIGSYLIKNRNGLKNFIRTYGYELKIKDHKFPYVVNVYNNTTNGTIKTKYDIVHIEADNRENTIVKFIEVFKVYGKEYTHLDFSLNGDVRFEIKMVTEEKDSFNITAWIYNQETKKYVQYLITISKNDNSINIEKRDYNKWDIDTVGYIILYDVYMETSYNGENNLSARKVRLEQLDYDKMYDFTKEAIVKLKSFIKKNDLLYKSYF